MAATVKKATKAPAKEGASAAAAGMIKIKWYRSAIATPQKHKRIVKGLGFTRLNQIVERQNTAAIRGMVEKIPHLVRIEP
jgi:large subunit ribosomal protein L30